MANIKNFGIAGVGSTVQFGKGGAKLVQTDGQFAAKSADGAALVRFAIANAVAGEDAVSFAQLNALIAETVGDMDKLQLELDASQAGAGLSADGEYIAKQDGIIANAVSLADADDKLAAALAVEIAARGDADDAMALDIANAQGDIVELTGELTTTQTALGLTPEGELALADGNYLAGATSLTNAVELLDAATKAAADDASEALSGLSGATDAIEALEGNVATLQGDVLDLEGNAIAQQGQIDAALLKNEQQDGRLTAVEADVALLQGEMDAVEGRASALEAGALEQGNAITLLNNEMDVVEGRALALEGRATGLEGRADVLEADLNALEANAVLKDGSVAYTADQSMGGFKLTNVAAPAADGDAANKQYVDELVGNLGNAFNYVGTLEGGADEANAFNLSDLPEGGKDAGDYYKVVEAGYIRIGEGDAVYFNTNDGLVINSLGSFDKIDNTDAVSRGTAGQVVVTGSVDTGFDIAIDAAYTAARQQEVSDEANARAGADVLLGNRIDGVEADLAQEVLDRANAVAVVDGRVTDLIEGEVAALEANAVAQQADILALQQAQADDSRLVALEANAVVQQGEIESIAGDVAAVEGRALALEGRATDLEGRATDVEARALALEGNVATLQGEMDAVEGRALALEGDVSALQADVADVEGRALALEGNVATLQGEMDAMEANAVAQQSAIDGLADAIENLSQDTIRSAGDIYTVHAADDKIVVANAEADASVEMVLVNGEATIQVVSTEADADLRLMAQGDGSVVIGDEGVGIIQADDGYDMIVAGGTDANLRLAGESVVIQNADAVEVATFTSGGDAKVDVSTTSNAVVFAAEGVEANVDLVFDPKGAGRVDFSGAQVVNVAAGSQADHAVNKGQMDAALAAAEVGHVVALSASLNEQNGQVNVGTVDGVITRIRVVILNAYNAGASIQIGHETIAADLADASDIDEAAAGVYVIETAREYIDTDVIVTVSGATVGQAKVYVEYIKG